MKAVFRDFDLISVRRAQGASPASQMGRERGGGSHLTQSTGSGRSTISWDSGDGCFLFSSCPFHPRVKQFLPHSLASTPPPPPPTRPSTDPRPVISQHFGLEEELQRLQRANPQTICKQIHGSTQSIFLLIFLFFFFFFFSVSHTHCI